MEANGLSRAQGVKAREATAQRLGLDAEHGSGSRDRVRRHARQLLSDLQNSGYPVLGPGEALRGQPRDQQEKGRAEFAEARFVKGSLANRLIYRNTPSSKALTTLDKT
jgi:hypothetical protein